LLLDEIMKTSFWQKRGDGHPVFTAGKVYIHPRIGKILMGDSLLLFRFIPFFRDRNQPVPLLIPITHRAPKIMLEAISCPARVRGGKGDNLLYGDGHPKSPHLAPFIHLFFTFHHHILHTASSKSRLAAIYGHQKHG
jgi:hypothetical protein